MTNKFKVSLNCSVQNRMTLVRIVQKIHTTVQYSMLKLNSSLKKDFGLQSMHWRMYY
jgi:hypothetical protein